MLKNKGVITYFMFVLLRPRRNDREQFQNFMTQKISIFKKDFTAKITLISMIKKMPLTFLDVKK